MDALLDNNLTIKKQLDWQIEHTDKRGAAVSKVKLTLITLLLLFSASNYADVTVPKLVSDGVILQRDTDNQLWGWADDGEKVTIKLNGEVVGSDRAKSGMWSITLAGQPAGGPHTITIAGNNTVLVNDVLFGDVWLASGQSNMQTDMARVKVKYPDEVATANNNTIRHFVIPRKYNYDAPQLDVDNGQWQAVSRDTIESFSAVGYFFAKHLQQSKHIPIGIINSSFGGSPVEAWMSEEALKAYPHYLDVVRKYRQPGYLAGLISEDKKRNDTWYQLLNQQDQGLQAQPWYAEEYDHSTWPQISVPGFWQDQGVAMANGAIWFKKDIHVSKAQASAPALLSLGRIVDADKVYINGVEVGQTTYQYPPRRYDIAKGLLKPGKNVITVRVISNVGKGGFIADKPYFIKLAGQKIDLTGNWFYQVGAEMPATPPAVFNQYKQPLGFYNAMLAPVLRTAIKGVIWYQGESNTDRPTEYRELFPAMIRHWRKQFAQGDFPFIFVQLANFMAAQSQPVESYWAETREAQRLALSEPNTAMAVSIDVGEWNDIHPLNKKAVADRLALAARKLAYGEQDLVYSGPLFKHMQVKGNKAVLQFELFGSQLAVKGKKPLSGFAIAGKDGKFVWAKAQIVGDSVEVWSEQVTTPAKVRYGWADNPTVNLVNAQGLPASPFQAE